MAAAPQAKLTRVSAMCQRVSFVALTLMSAGQFQRLYQHQKMVISQLSFGFRFIARLWIQSGLDKTSGPAATLAVILKVIVVCLPTRRLGGKNVKLFRRLPPDDDEKVSYFLFLLFLFLVMADGRCKLLPTKAGKEERPLNEFVNRKSCPRAHTI